MTKPNAYCQVSGCMRRASHQPMVRVWPVGTPASLATRCVEMKLRAHNGVCKRHADALGPDDVLNDVVRTEIVKATRTRYSVDPDMGTVQVLMRRIGSK